MALNLIFKTMKKFKIGAMALALTLGVAGAFATSSSASAGKRLNPNWQTVNPTSGATILVASGGIYDANRTSAQAAADLGCSSGTKHCASTVNSQDAAPNGVAFLFKP
jgi:hypothetical protein